MYLVDFHIVYIWLMSKFDVYEFTFPSIVLFVWNSRSDRPSHTQMQLTPNLPTNMIPTTDIIPTNIFPTNIIPTNIIPTNISLLT